MAMNLNEQEMVSEESEEEGGGESREEMIYRRKYQMLLERCEVLQQDNERLVHRIQQVYKYTRQVRKEKKFLINRLDNYGDNWRQKIAQCLYEDSIQYIKPHSKQKLPQSGEKRPRKSSSTSQKRTPKEKTDSDQTGRKHLKEISGKHSGKNAATYSFYS